MHDGTGGRAGMCADGLDTEAAKLAITIDAVDEPASKGWSAAGS